MGGGNMGMGIGGAIFFLFWLFLMLGGLVGWIIFLVAIWRWMRAHERLSDSVGEVVDILRQRGED
jgi:biopolymer transport protein ExbB/TolQ